MPISDSDLWSRIRSHVFPPSNPLNALGRSWPTDGYEQWRLDLCIMEYRKYLLLLATTEEPLAPSPAVNTLWYLHANAADGDYGRLWEAVILKPPPRPDQRKFRANAQDYLTTLRRYQEVFEAPPHAKIWPNNRTINRHRLLWVCSGLAVCTAMWPYAVAHKSTLTLASLQGAISLTSILSMFIFLLWASIAGPWRIGVPGRVDWSISDFSSVDFDTGCDGGDSDGGDCGGD